MFEQSKLAKFKESILEQRQSGSKIEDIRLWLITQDCQISFDRLSKFISFHLRDDSKITKAKPKYFLANPYFENLALRITKLKTNITKIESKISSSKDYDVKLLAVYNRLVNTFNKLSKEFQELIPPEKFDSEQFKFKAKYNQLFDLINSADCMAKFPDLQLYLTKRLIEDDKKL